ncbi:MAG: hypothetical protein CMLOHMNK_00112 [Steroidobacteraceae bacterium]|nr:hypothetical protein [Steroidobacteraceae bacterium]
MFRTSVTAATLLAIAILAGWSPTAPAADDLADRFAALPAISALAVAPDGRRIALMCERDGHYAACVYELDAIDKPPQVIRTRPEQRLRGLDWAGPEWVLLSVDITEDLTAVTLNRRLVRLSRIIAHNVRTGEGSSLLVNTETGFTTDLTGITAKPAATPDEVLMIALFQRIPRDPFSRIGSEEDNIRTGLYQVNLKSGKGRLVEDGGPDTTDIIADPEGRPIARVEYDPKRRRDRIYRLDSGGSATLIFESPQAGRASYSVAGLLSGGRGLAVGAYADAGLLTPNALDLATGKLGALEGMPVGVDFDGWIQDGSAASIVGFRFAGDGAPQQFLDPALQRARNMLSKALPGKVVTLESWSADRMTIGLSVAGPGEPGAYYLFDAGQKALSPVGVAYPQLSTLPIATTTRVRYAARDGLEIDAYLTLPPGRKPTDGPFPLLLMPHGGPFTRDDAGFDWWSGYFAQRGYAVFKPNFRGSRGYGLAFREKGYNEFGGAMIDDIIDGAKYLEAKQIADPGRVCAMGGSYGGYAALMIPIRDPSIIKCAIAVNAVTEPDEIIGEMIKRYGGASGALDFWEDYLGSRFRDAGSKAAISPLRNAKAIKVPVLLLHATQDTTVPIEQSRALKRRMEEAGGSVRLVELAGGEHFLDTSAMRRTLLTEADDFLRSRLPAGSPPNAPPR